MTPALLVAADDLHARVSDGSDEGLQTVEFPVTTWWQLELPTKKKAPPARASDRPAKSQRKPAAPVEQVNIFEPKPVEPPPTPPTPAEPTLFASQRNLPMRNVGPVVAIMGEFLNVND